MNSLNIMKPIELLTEEMYLINNHLILAYIWCFKLSGLIGSMGLVDVRKPPSTGTAQSACHPVLPPVVKHTVSVAELIGI